MPNAKGKGGKQRKRGKNENEISKREIVLKGDGEAYAVVVAPMGQYQMTLRLEDSSTVTGIIRGALRKKTWINGGDLVRVALRTGFDDGTVDIVGKYTANEAAELSRNNEISMALLAGPQAASDSAAGRAGATAIHFVQSTGGAAASENAREKNQPDPNTRNKNVEMVPIMRNLNRQGVGIGGSDDEEPEDNGPQWRANKRKGDSSDDDDEDEEDEEDEEGEEGEEEEEEEEDDGANAAAYYDDGRANANQDWEKYHNNKKDQTYKQRNKRAKENKPSTGVTSADVADI